MLPAETLIAEAAKQAAKAPFPKPRDLPIDTFVVLMMENRSFDHYFGWHPKADGRNSGLSYPNLDGTKTFETHHLVPDFQGCDFRDPDHGWVGGRHQYNRGRMDGFYTGNPDGDGSDEFALGYYLKEDLGFLPHAAAAYTLYDRWFTSIMGSTYPNRHYQISAQNGGQKSNVLPVADDPEYMGAEWESIFDRALARGITIGYYVSDLPVPGLYGQRGLAWARPASQFYTDAANGNLPQITFIDPPFRDGGGGDGVSADDHPHGDVRLGQAFMSDVAHAFIESPQYERGAMFINYDEWGGFFDHVRPRHVPDDRANRKNLDEDWSLTGFRIPAVAISPYARGGGNRVSHMTCTHESILKLISYRYGLGYLNKRHRYASNIGRSFNFNKARLRAPAAAGSGGDRRDALLGGRQWAARRSTTWRRWRPPAISTGSATRCRRSPTTRSSVTRTRSAGRSRSPTAEREGNGKGPRVGPLVPKGRTSSESRRWHVGPSSL